MECFQKAQLQSNRHEQFSKFPRLYCFLRNIGLLRFFLYTFLLVEYSMRTNTHIYNLWNKANQYQSPFVGELFKFADLGKLKRIKKLASGKNVDLIVLSKEQPLFFNNNKIPVHFFLLFSQAQLNLSTQAWTMMSVSDCGMTLSSSKLPWSSGKQRPVGPKLRRVPY